MNLWTTNASTSETAVANSPTIISPTVSTLDAEEKLKAPQRHTNRNSPYCHVKYFFPFFTLFICSGYNAAFALYWVVSNIYGWVESIVFNKVLEKQDAASAAAVKEDSVK